MAGASRWASLAKLSKRGLRADSVAPQGANAPLWAGWQQMLSPVQVPRGVPANAPSP